VRDPLVHVRGSGQVSPRPSPYRDAVIDGINEIIVVPVTRTIRGIGTEVVLTIDDGMPAACALNFDHVALAQRARIGSVITTLTETRWPEAERALLIACGFAVPSDEP